MDSSVARELTRMFGENVRSGEKVLAPYFRDPIDRAELLLVTPRDVDQLADACAFSFENEMPLFSVKRKYIEDAALAGREGILLDLSRMNHIKKIDTRNLTAHVYAGVTFEQLQKELTKENQRLLFPVAGQSPSVVRSYIDRDVLMGSGGYRHPHLSIFHAMMADGQVWVSGSQQMADEGHADFREDQGPQFSPFFGASEDIFGIPYYGLVYTYPNREERRLLAFGFDDVGPAKDLVYRVSRAEWCFEAFCANDRYLSVLLAGGDTGKVAQAKKKLNPWTVVITLEHYRDLVDLWDGYIKEASKELGGKLLRGAVPQQLEALLEKPWYVYDRDYYRGRCRHVFCYQYFKNMPDTFSVIDEAASASGVEPGELGRIFVPSYFGGAAYCEADLYYDPADEKASASAEKAYLKAFESLLDNRAFIDKPTGKVAEMVYSLTDPSYVEVVKMFKRAVDPKGFLNPDELLEGV
ncbi:MAG: FAD-binding oxidoreductase [Actinobacteria bacterium]|nr:FAD-binding oxidoreductase [Actinomycetota bacterium]